MLLNKAKSNGGKENSVNMTSDDEEESRKIHKLTYQKKNLLIYPIIRKTQATDKLDR